VGEVPHIEELASILCCNISSLPLRYLDLPLGAPFKSIGIWDGVVEKMKRRLASWNKLFLSKGASYSHQEYAIFFIFLPFTSWYS
jgi:hypothetical protein